MGHEGRESRAQRFRKIEADIVHQIRIVRNVGLQQALIQLHLAIGQQHRKLGPRQPLARRMALGDGLLVGQELDLSIKHAGTLQRPHESCRLIDQRRRLGLGVGQRHALAVVVH